MNRSEEVTMLTQIPLSENDGALKEDSSLNDLDVVIGKLSVSPVLGESSYVRGHEPTVCVVTSDNSCADALSSAFTSVNVVECPEQRDDVAKSNAFASNGDAVHPVQTLDQNNDTGALHSEFANVAEPSTGRDVDADVLDKIDAVCKEGHAMNVYTSSRRNTRGIKSNQKKQSAKPSRSHRRIVGEIPSLDFDSLQISRRRRSLVKRAPTPLWGAVGNIFLDSDRPGIDPNTGNRKKTSRKSSSQGKKQTAKESLSKSCTPTGPISLKIKIGDQIIMPIHEKLDASNTSRNHNQVNIQEEGCNLRANTENRFLDPGTSPDSEVINSIPDAEVFEKGLHDVQDSSITLSMPFDNAAGISLPPSKSKKGKQKDNQFLLGDCSMESKLTGKETTNNAKELAAFEPGSKVCSGEPFPLNPLQLPRMSVPGSQITTSKDAEMNNFSNLVAVSGSSHSEAAEALIHCNRGQRISKICKKNEGMSETLDSRGKKKKASGKGGNKSNSSGKVQVTEKDKALITHNGVESQLIEGNQSSIPEEGGQLSIVSSELIADGSTNRDTPTESAWVRCDECGKWRRISETLADHIRVTNCEWTCRENSDKDFSDCSIPQEKSDSEINKELEISDEEEAPETIQKSEKKQSKVDRPPSWSHIKSNSFLHRTRKTQPIDEVMVCHCKPPSDGRMGCGAECLNRMLNIECVRGTCPCDELCSNQQFQKRKYAKVKWFRCGKKGFGLQSLEEISTGQFIIEYVGEVLDIHNYEARQRDYALKGHRHFYFMTLNGSEVIDACVKGNLGRFINHSCEPNCRTEKWMVNGEVCVGLFAIKDIKKGEELTFDYNYVRVFGAAVKKCVCSSSNCRGYIGGDPTSSEVIVQDESDEEFAEPVKVSEDNDMRSDWNNVILNSSCDKENNISDEPSENGYGEEKLVGAAGQFSPGTLSPKSGVISTAVATQVLNRVVQQEVEAVHFSDGSPSDAVWQLNVDEASDKSLFGSSSAASKIGSRLNFHTHSSIQLVDNSESRMSKAVHSSELEHPPTETTASPHKSQLDIAESKKKSKGNSLARPHSSTSSIRKGKLKTKNRVNFNGNSDSDKTNAAVHKSRKFSDLTLNGHVEAVEEKLNQLLDSDGGISKRRDASKGYLKLLFLTAASGNTRDGESIQSNRDLSMILDALLKTKSRTVLVDIINKNGLQMLHNIMKRYRKEFYRTPILRKLLKILEYLANKEILTSEHITGGPPRPGVESFKDSILTLTEHADKQVHQIARSFRDTWIRKFLRRNCHMEMDEYHHHTTYNNRSSSSSSYGQHNDRGVKPLEAVVVNHCQKQPSTTAETTSTTVDHQSSGSALTTCTTNTTRTRKRKSRWDTPADEHVYPKVSINNNSATDETQETDMDAPPGFSTPCNNAKIPRVVSSFNQETNTSGFVLGESHPRFTARAPVSYGVPSSVMEQFGVLQGEVRKGWTMAPGIPFCPFPPLPPDPKSSVDHSISGGESLATSSGTATSVIGQKRAFTCSNNLDDSETNGSGEQGGGSYSLGRKYFKQQKLNTNPKSLPPWVRMRNGWGNGLGNNS